MKYYSSILLSFCLLLTFNLSVLAQEPNNHEKRMEKYRSMKIAYFSDNMDLTPEEAEIFWPLYNKFEKQKAELKTDRRMRSRAFSENAEQLNELEAEQIIDQHIENRQKEVEIDTEFHKELKKVLPAKKIMKFYVTEVHFREYMLRRIREQRGEEEQKRNKQ
ncbi:hypothetical protein ACFLSP_02590 [Bacteroidota bacterium]